MLRTLVVALALSALPAMAQDAPVRLKVMSFNIWYGGEQVNFGTVAEAIKAAGADIVGVQETDGNLARLAEMTGLTHYDVRRNIISRYPIFDPAMGERQAAGSGPYSMPPLDADAVHAYVMVAPGKVVAMANTHLTSDPYGPYTVRDGGTAADAVQVEIDTRVPEAQLLADGLRPVAATGMPVFLTGDFNTPSHLDWVAAVSATRPAVRFAVEWPVSRLLFDAGLDDSFRAVHPDPAAIPGLTWTAGTPSPHINVDETLDRIDWVLYANANPLESTVVGETGGPDVGIGVDPWPSDHRAVVTTFDVTPVDAPALITVEPARVGQADDFLIRAFMPGFGAWASVVVPRGGDAATDGLTGISGVSLTDRPTVKLSASTLPPGAYDAVLLDSADSEVARSHFNVIADGSHPVIATDKPEYAVGESIVANWNAAQGERFEWIGVYGAKDPNVYNYWGYTYTAGHVDGTTSIGSDVFGDPLPSGDYELRLMRDDHYSVEAVAPLTVR